MITKHSLKAFFSLLIAVFPVLRIMKNTQNMLDSTKTSLLFLAIELELKVPWTQLSMIFRNLDHKLKERD